MRHPLGREFRPPAGWTMAGEISPHSRFKGKMPMISHRAIRVLSVVTLTAALAACGAKQESWPPATEFNQKLTDAARPISSLPADVEQLQCWAEKPLVRPDRVLCNVSLRGPASKDIGRKVIGWDIPIDGPSSNPFDRLREAEPRNLYSYQFDLPLLAGTGFLFVAKNTPQGLSIEVAANQNRVSFGAAQAFIVAVLPVVSSELSRQLKEARDAAPDSIRATWARK